MRTLVTLVVVSWLNSGLCRDEEKIMKACYWPNELYEPCFGGCAEVSCDNPRNHLRPCYPYCEPGCVCEDPYVRDDRTHQCVLPQDCSPTQMGIPVPSRRGNNKASLASGLSSGAAPPPAQAQLLKYDSRPPRTHNKRSEMLAPPENMSDNDLPQSGNDFKRASEISRMGNYFNIVIAPPPIKALQPRKLLTNDIFRNSPKRLS